MLSTKPFPGEEIIPLSNSLPASSFKNKISNLPRSFGLIPLRPNFNAFHESNAFPPDEYKVIHNHFQGIQRLANPKYFVISGANEKNKSANLLIGKAEYYSLVPGSASQSYGYARIESALGSNVFSRGITPQQDSLIGIYKLNKDLPDYWHAGGMDICGNILVVPLENSSAKQSKIRFYDVSAPIQLKRLNGEININGNSGSVALVHLSDGRFLCASWTDSDDGEDRFDYYLSKKNSLNEWSNKIPFAYRVLTPEDEMNPKFQAINFIEQNNGQLFIVGTENSNKLAPIINGVDRAYLYEVILFKDNQGKDRVSMVKINQRDFKSGGSFSNFGAATGFYTNSLDQLSMYSAHHWRTGKTVKLSEYWPVLLSNHPKVSFKRDLIIELYEHRYFNGRCLRLFGEKFSSLNNFNNIQVEGKVFNDKISSIRMILPEQYDFIIYVDKNQKNIGSIFPGNGFVQEWPDLGLFNDDFSSCGVISK